MQAFLFPGEGLFNLPDYDITIRNTFHSKGCWLEKQKRHTYCLNCVGSSQPLIYIQSVQHGLIKACLELVGNYQQLDL